MNESRRVSRVIKRLGWLSAVLAAVLTAAPASSAPAFSVQLTSAPVNPAFTKYLASRRMKPAGAGPRSSRLGYIPPPVYLPHMLGAHPKGAQPPGGGGAHILHAAITDASFDLRTTGKLTAVRDQGACGSCWMFATYGSLESALLPGATWDFSENNLKNLHGFSLDGCAGGNHYMSAAYLGRRAGPVLETDDPYNDSSGVSPAGLTVQQNVKEMLFLPNRAGSLDNDNIEQALIDYGAVYTAISWQDAAFNAATNAFYYNGAEASNHAVAIVGWDDNFAAANFNAAPAGDGAFIVRNSWGSAWGDSGYFYVSYYDVKVEDNVVFATAQDPAAHSYVYEYDPLGWVSSGGLGGGTPKVGWMANIFTITGYSDTINQVGFYTADVNVDYVVKLYTGVSASLPTSGTLVDTRAGTLAFAGFHTVDVTSTKLSNGQRFSVVVKLTDPTSVTPIAVETALGGYSDSASASDGESFVSADGATWSDLNQLSAGSNACVKAYSSEHVDQGPQKADLDGVRTYPNPAKLSEGGRIRFADIPFDARDVKIQVFTIGGKLVRTLTEGRGVSSDTSTGAAMKFGLWDGRNDNGEKVASGVYIVVIRASNKDAKKTKVGVFW